MYKVIIVEDDPMVASINKQYVEGNAILKVAGIFHNGKEALGYARKQPVDLAIVDYYMPLMDGYEFIRNCHDAGLKMDYIMITAANTVSEIESIMRYGVVDYLIKPFTYQRFSTAITRFVTLRETLEKKQQMSQEELDKLLGSNSVSSDNSALLAKGLQQKTLDMIQEYLKAHACEFLSSEDIARNISLTRITVRRYMNYLLETGQILSQIDYGTGGRPSIKYKLK